MRDMVAQCESNMSELQQLQVISPVPQLPQGSQGSEAKGSTAGPHPRQAGPGAPIPACHAAPCVLRWISCTTLADVPPLK